MRDENRQRRGRVSREGASETGGRTVGVVFSAWLTLPVIPTMAEGSEEDWLDAMVNAVRVIPGSEGDHNGAKYEPYLDQLHVARIALRRGDEPAVFATMNRFMDMLENREHGIAPGSADWLFDFCYVVTPAKYHDVSRHIQKFKEHQFWEPVG